MSRPCPHCRKPIPDPTLADFERLPQRDRERVLERMAVRKAGSSAPAPKRAMLAQVSIDEHGNVVAQRCL